MSESGYSYAEFAALSPKVIRSTLRQEIVRRDPPDRYFALLKVFPKVHESFYEGNADLRESWTLYKSHNPGSYGYSQFVAHFRAWQRVQGVQVARYTTWRIIQVCEEDMVELKKWRSVEKA
jgi:hypothetical protein